MGDRNQRLAINDLRGGRNGADPPQYLNPTQVAEAVNVDWYNATVARKRTGVETVVTTSSPFTGELLSSFYRHVPTTDETLAELWATDGHQSSPHTPAPHLGRLAGGTVWTTPTLKDAATGNGWDFSYASLNGKLFIAYKSAVDRLHVWDPVSNSVRRTGMAVMAAPTAADDAGGGGYPAVLRYYRTRAVELRSGIVVRRSEPSASSAAFTPSGTNDGVVVTQHTPPGEGETHWEVEESLDGVIYYRIATVLIATTTYLDIVNALAVASNPLSDVTGTYGLQTSFRSIAADQGRLLGFGNYTTTDPQNQVVFSAVIGSSNIGDDERVPLNNFIGLDENDSGPAIGLKGPVGGSFFAFKSRQVHKLTPTGNVTAPYSVIKVSPTVGALTMQSITVGEDEIGNPALYWQSLRGPYRYGAQGVEYLGKGVEDKTIGAAGGVSLNLTPLITNVPAHTLWYGALRQVWFWVATGIDADPDIVLAFSVGRQGPYLSDYQPSKAIDAWSLFTGGIAAARCAAMFSNTIGAANSLDLKPYIGSSATTNTIGKCDTGTQDFGVSYRGYLTTQAYSPWPDGSSGTVMGADCTAVATPGVTLQLTTVGDFGAQTRSDTASLTAPPGATRARPRFGGGIVASGLAAAQFTIGDAGPANTAWQIDDLTITWRSEGPTVA